VRVRSVLGLAAFVVPAAAAILFVARFGVDVPAWDEWLFVPFLERVAQGQATLDDWLAPHNEHVVVVPRLLLAGLAFTFGWNIWIGLAAGLLFAGGTVLTLRSLAHAPGEKPLLLASDLATALLLFSLVQWENWLWGMQSAWFLANLCVALALLALRPGEVPPGPGRIALAAAACLVATLTTAQGPFAWLAMLPLVAWGGGKVRPRVGAVAAWLMLTAGAWALLFVGLRHARHPPTVAALWREPTAVAQFFLGLLGAPLASSPKLAVALGALLLGALLVLTVVSLRGPRLTLALPWCALGGFAAAVAAATAVSRVGFGVDYAVTSRYTTNAVLAWVAGWHLARLWLETRGPRVGRSVTLVLLGALAALVFATGRAALESGNAEYLWRSGGRACLELGPLLESTPLSEGPMLYLFMRPAGARKRFDTLVDLGVRRARPRPALETPSDARLGLLTRVPRAGASTSDAEIAAGWMVVDDLDHPPLLLLSVNEGRSFVAAHQLVEGVAPLGVRVRFRSRDVAEWEVPLAENGPRAAGPVSAWRFDPAANLITRLGSAGP
jgi:hypothetical protein